MARVEATREEIIYRIQERTQDEHRREALVRLSDEALSNDGVTAGLTDQKGIEFSIAGSALMNMFPKTDIQIAIQRPYPYELPTWADPGPVYVKLYFDRAHDLDELLTEALALLPHAVVRPGPRRKDRSGPVKVSRISPDRRAELIPYAPQEGPIHAAYTDPIPANTELIDRGNSAHRELEERIEKLCRDAKLDPKKERALADIDIGWVDGDALYIVEVKSLTEENEVRQLRLGLGQVLDYRSALTGKGNWTTVHAILAVEQEPSDLRWKELCATVGVQLVWPGCLMEAFA